jgi:hypothetical protein
MKWSSIRLSNECVHHINHQSIAIKLPINHSINQSISLLICQVFHQWEFEHSFSVVHVFLCMCMCVFLLLCYPHSCLIDVASPILPWTVRELPCCNLLFQQLESEPVILPIYCQLKSERKCFPKCLKDYQLISYR